MASSQDKIVDYLIARLQDNRPDVRLKAIQELDALGAKAVAAVGALKSCYDKSDEKEVKQAARETGYKIFMAAKEDTESD